MEINIDTLTTFFGWATLINFSFLILALFAMAACQDSIMGIHHKLFNIKKDKLPKMYMNHLGRYKIMIITFNLVPYIVLKIMAG